MRPSCNNNNQQTYTCIYEQNQSDHYTGSSYRPISITQTPDSDIVQNFKTIVLARVTR